MMLVVLVFACKCTDVAVDQACGNVLKISVYSSCFVVASTLFNATVLIYCALLQPLHIV